MQCLHRIYAASACMENGETLVVVVVVVAGDSHIIIYLYLLNSFAQNNLLFPVPNLQNL